MLKAWKIAKPFTIVDIKPNLYIISFENAEDKQKVINGQPWLFDSYLLALKSFNGCIPPLKMKFTIEIIWIHMHNWPMACMNEEMEKLLGSAIEKVQDCDVDKDGKAWGPDSLSLHWDQHLDTPSKRTNPQSSRKQDLDTIHLQRIAQNMFQMRLNNPRGTGMQ